MRIDKKTADCWSQLAAKLKQISELADQCELILLLRLNGEEKPLKVIRNILDAVNGQAYMFTPQTEWTGGDPSDSNNYKCNLPHIARN